MTPWAASLLDYVLPPQGSAGGEAAPGVGSHGAAHNALFMGLVYGVLHVIGPDHLGTLMTLSSVTSRMTAFRVGAAWGLGHSFGMVFIAAIFVSVHHVLQINVMIWEHYGNYLIGVSMMLCALYFILRESSFLQQQDDGTFVAQPCACHGVTRAVALHTSVPIANQHSQAAHADCCSSCAPEGLEGQHDAGGCCSSCKEHPPTGAKGQPLETTVLLPGGEKLNPDESGHESWWQRLWAERDVNGALVGALQGLCCPLGLLGVSFLANLPVTSIAAFLVVFMCVSASGTATLAVAWAVFTAHGLGSNVSPRVIYRTSCAFTMSLGALWILCNYCGVLEKLDYTEGLERHPR